MQQEDAITVVAASVALVAVVIRVQAARAQAVQAVAVLVHRLIKFYHILKTK